MQKQSGRLVSLLGAMSNPNRLMILCHLVDGERSVGDLAKLLSLRPSTASQHLARLRREGLVTFRRDAQTLYYSLASTEARTVLDTLYSLYCASETVPGPGPRNARQNP